MASKPLTKSGGRVVQWRFSGRTVVVIGHCKEAAGGSKLKRVLMFRQMMISEVEKSKEGRFHSERRSSMSPVKASEGALGVGRGFLRFGVPDTRVWRAHEESCHSRSRRFRASSGKCPLGCCREGGDPGPKRIGGERHGDGCAEVRRCAYQDVQHRLHPSLCPGASASGMRHDV